MRVHSWTVAAFVGALLGTCGFASADLLDVVSNGDFEADPFTSDWSDGIGVFDNNESLDGTAGSAAYINNDTDTGTFGQQLNSIEDWVFETTFAVENHGTGRSLNMGLSHTGGGFVGINLRTIGSDLEILTPGFSWQTIFSGAIGFSVNSDQNNTSSFSKVGDTLVTHRLRVVGNYGDVTPSYDVFLSNPNSTDPTDNSSLGLMLWQDGDPVQGSSLNAVNFFATGAAGGDYAIDDVSVIVDVPPFREWDIDGSGSWKSGTNWILSVVPNGSEVTVTFGPVITSPQTVFTNSAVTAKAIVFGDTNASTVQQSYAIAGQGSINLESDTNVSTISVLEGSHQFQAIVNLVNQTNLDVATGAVLAFNNALNLGVNDLTKTGDGELQINNALNSGGGVVNAAAGVVSGVGLVSGNLNNTGATVAPGNSPGTLSIGGDYTQSAGSLEIEIDGPLAGSEHDVLKVAGDLNVTGGSLDVVFNALPGEFSILDVTGTSSVAFASVNNTGAVQNVSFDVSDLASGILTVLSIEPGDMNGDLLVNSADAALFVQALVNRTAYNANGFFADTDMNGDLNGDLSFDLGDLGLFSGLLGGPASASAVPEPASASLLATILCALALVGRRKQ